LGEFKCKVTYYQDNEKHEVHCYGNLEEDSNVLVVWGEDGEEIYADGVESSWTKTVRKIASEMFHPDLKGRYGKGPIHEVTSC